jgi:hypothetical protein
MGFQTGGTDRLATEKPFNNLLRTLRDQDYALIVPHLVEAEQAANELLYNPGDDVDLVYFPCGSTLVSFLVSNEDGRDVETIWSGAKAPSAALSVTAGCRPTAASWSSMAARSCASR